MNVPTAFDDIPDDLHHSVPNMHFSYDSRQAHPIRESEAMHHSLPNMYYDETSAEPLPDHIVIPDLAEKESGSVFEEEDEPMAISSSLIDSLAKITESAGADDNPFEPIPLSPASKRRPSVAMGKDNFPNIDEQSLPDAFVEEV